MDEDTGTVLFIIFFLIAFFAVLIPIYVHKEHVGEKHKRIEYVCEYLGGQRQGEVCVVNGKVVSTKRKG